MNRVVGIICEYDPFHRGHQKQLAMIRESDPDALILCVMSGPFTQRGMPALFSPAFRAGAAIEAGADLVLELPCAFAVRDAEHFAQGGIELLNSLGFVTHLCFGCEDGLETLLPIAQCLETPTEAFTECLKRKLRQGLSYPAAQGEAIREVLGDTPAFAKPNNILAITYLRALWRTGSSILPMSVLREGDYHASELKSMENPSASAIRNAFLSGRTEDAEAACGYCLQGIPYAKPDALDSLLLWQLRTSNPSVLAKLPDCTEGLENLLYRSAKLAATGSELRGLLKTKRYSYTRLSRLCCHALLGIHQELLAKHPAPEYARILGLRPGPWTALLGKSKIPILAKATDGNHENELFRLDEKAWELWALAAGLPAGLLYREKMSLAGSKAEPFRK